MEPLNVLLVSYVFPPVGGTGVMRAASLARYLPAESIRLDVLTTRNPAAVGTTPTLLKDIPESVTVHRTLTLDLPFGAKKAIKRFLMGANSSKKTTTAPAGRTQREQETRAAEAHRRQCVSPGSAGDMVSRPLACGSANHSGSQDRSRSNHGAGLLESPSDKEIRKQFPDLPIVADFRDEWITTSFELVSFSFSDSPRAEQTARRIEAETVANATTVVAVTECRAAKDSLALSTGSRTRSSSSCPTASTRRR